MGQNFRAPGRRYWTDHWHIRALGAVAILILAASSVSMWLSINRLKMPHSPHFQINSCTDCHETSSRDKLDAKDCFVCHDPRTRALLPGAPTVFDCDHPIKQTTHVGSRRTPTELCLMCHSAAKPLVAMTNFTTGEYWEIDIALAHPIGLMPTETIYPKTLPLGPNGAITCVTCHDQHSIDPRMRLMRLYHPGNGRPADFRPLCLDCHEDGWMPVTMKGVIQELEHE